MSQSRFIPIADWNPRGELGRRWRFRILFACDQSVVHTSTFAYENEPDALCEASAWIRSWNAFLDRKGV